MNCPTPKPAIAVLDLQDQSPPFDWSAIFSTSVDRVELEIGCGKGRFLRREAADRPQVGFLGVEKAAKFFRIGAERIERDGCKNVRVVCADAFDLLSRWVSPASLQAVHIYFPDPWPKKRHAKRRLLRPALFDLIARALACGGTLSTATDVAPYFDEATSALDAHPAFERCKVSADEIEALATNYALKYAKEGRPLHLARYRRTASAPPPLPPPPSRHRESASRYPSHGTVDPP